MRARGAKVTDIAVVVVAADDGVMPQTLEAISHAKAAKVPIIIALNKIDKPDANADRVKTELTEAGIVVEEYGGDVPLVPVSAKTRIGLDELIEMILLVADLQELKANPKRSAIGTIVEAKLDKGRGPVATALVQTGTLKVGDIIVVGETFGRVRALENDMGKRVTKAGPSSAVVILGLSEVPQAGDILRVVGDEKEARTMVETRKAAIAAKSGEGSGRATLEDLYSQIQAGQAKELRIILKADVSGSLGAITHALEQLDQDEIRLNVLHEGAGDITDNDIMLAAASNAIVVGFNTKITETARRAAESEGVDVRLYDIIYKLTDDVEAALKGLLEPEIVEVVEGRAEVRQVIRVGKSTVIAGSFVTDGRIVRGGNARIWRSGKVIATDRIESLRRFRDDVREVQQNYECGIGLANFHDVVEGDIIECFTSQTVSRPGESRADPTASNVDEPTNRPGRRTAAAGDRVDRRPGRGGPAGRVRDDHVGRDDPGPSPRQGLGERHRPARRARRGGRGAPPRDAVHPPRARQAAADQAHPGPARPSRRHRRARDADPPAPRRDRRRGGPGPGPPADRVAADAGRPGPPGRGPARGATVGRPRPGAAAAAEPSGRLAPAEVQGRVPQDDASAVPVTVDLTPYLDVVPQVVVDRLRGARRVLAVSHENPDADTLGATLGVVRLIEALGGAADAVCTDPVPPLYDFIAGIERFRTDPDTTAPYDLVVISDCGSLERIGDVGVRHADLFARLPRVVIDHHASNDGVGDADWIEPGAAATCEMVTLLAVRLGIPLDADDGALAAALMAGHRDGHRHVRALERDAAHAGRVGRPGRGRGAAVGHLAAPVPVQAGRPAAAVRGRPRAARDLGRPTDRLVERDRGGLRGDRRRAARFRGHHRPAVAGRGRRGLDPVQGGRAGDQGQRPDEARRRGRHGPDRAFGGGGHARAAGATVAAPLAEARPPVLAEAARLVAALAR